MEIQKEQTLVIIKPDGIQRSLVGEIIKRIERTGMKLTAMKMMIPNIEVVKNHYLSDDGWLENVGKKSIEAYKKKGKTPPTDNLKEAGEKVLDSLIKYMTSGPVVAMVWQGAHAASIVRKIVGGTEPLTSDVGTLRGDFVIDSYEIADLDGRAVRNIIHASGSAQEAEKEIKLWFNDSEVLKYRLIQEQILYDVNLDGILE